MAPTRRLYACLWTLAAFGLAASLLAPLRPVWWAAGTLLVLTVLVDGWMARRASASLELERRVAPVVPVDRWADVTLTVHNRGTRGADLLLHDGYPTEWELAGLPHGCRIPGGGFHALTYRVRPLERGRSAFDAAWLGVLSPAGLWRHTRRLGPQQAVKVFPDYSALLGQQLKGADRLVPLNGALQKRQRGEGTDFRQLREYRQGDSLRSIDWKATARHHKLISREYQQERDQQVVFLLDCGRRMLARDGRTSHFDHALHALLTLAYVAIKQGDSVGALCFGAETRWVAPAKGRVGLDHLLAGVYDLQPSEAAPDYPRAAQDLLQRLGKRALVIFLTNLRDEDDLAMRQACELLGRRHLVLCASLRERALDEALDHPVGGLNDALRTSAAALYLQQRDEAMRRLGLPASRLLDVTPERLGPGLLNRYLEVKESGAL
jgi:uncharacterized protein (DUF58 family)